MNPIEYLKNQTNINLNLLDISNLDVMEFGNGSEPKFKAVYNGKQYICKFKNKSYNNVLCEHYASKFINRVINISHNTMLARYNGTLCVMCEDFTFNTNSELHTFSSMASSFETDKHKYDYTFDDVVRLISKLKNIGDESENVIDRFWKQYIFDGILGNTDRHGGNWGVLVSDNGTYNGLAPIFDNGASLFPRTNPYNLSESFVKDLVFKFPNSKLMIPGKGERSTYTDSFKYYKEYMDPLIYELFNNLDIRFILKDVFEDCGREYRDLFITMIYYRYTTLILDKPFEWEGIITYDRL